MTAGAWGPWIEHDGKSVPLRAGVKVLVRRKNGTEHEGVVSGRLDSGWIWHFCEAMQMPGAAVTHYRVRRPSELIKLIDMAESLSPAIVREGEFA